MKRSTERSGQAYDRDAYARLVREAVAAVVRRQTEAGVDGWRATIYPHSIVVASAWDPTPWRQCNRQRGEH